MHALGTVFYGSRLNNVNLYIIDKDNSFEATMMWNGLAQRPCLDVATAKRASMSSKNQTALEAGILAVMGSGMTIPNWALAIINKTIYPNLSLIAPVLWSPPSTPPIVPSRVPGALVAEALMPRRGHAPFKRFQLPPELLPLIEKNLGMKLTDDEKPDKVDKVLCEHEFKDYFGLTDNFHFCIKCDLKIRMKQ